MLLSPRAERWRTAETPGSPPLHEIAMTTAGPHAAASDGTLVAEGEDGWRTVLNDGPAVRDAGLRSMAVTDDGTRLWFVDRSGTLSAYDVESGTRHDLTAPSDGATWVGVAVAGRAGEERGLVAHESGDVRAFVGTGTDVSWGGTTNPTTGDATVAVLAVSPDGTGYVVDTSGHARHTAGNGWRGMGRVNSQAALHGIYAGTKGRVAVAAGDGFLYQHDPEKGTWVGRRVTNAPVRAVDSADGTLVVGAGDGDVYVEPTGERFWQVSHTPASGPIRDLEADGETVVAVGGGFLTQQTGRVAGGDGTTTPAESDVPADDASTDDGGGGLWDTDGKSTSPDEVSGPKVDEANSTEQTTDQSPEQSGQQSEKATQADEQTTQQTPSQKQSGEQSSQKQSSKQASEKSSEERSSEQSSKNQTSEQSSKKQSAEKQTSKQSSESSEKQSSEEQTSKQPSEKQTSEKQSSQKSSGEQSSQKQPAEKQTSEKKSSGERSSEKQTSKQPSEKQTSEKQSSQKSSGEQSSQKQPAEKQTSEEQPSESSEKQSPEKQTSEQSSQKPPEKSTEDRHDDEPSSGSKTGGESAKQSEQTSEQTSAEKRAAKQSGQKQGATEEDLWSDTERHDGLWKSSEGRREQSGQDPLDYFEEHEAFVVVDFDEVDGLGDCVTVLTDESGDRYAVQLASAIYPERCSDPVSRYREEREELVVEPYEAVDSFEECVGLVTDEDGDVYAILVDPELGPEREWSDLDYFPHREGFAVVPYIDVERFDEYVTIVVDEAGERYAVLLEEDV